MTVIGAPVHYFQPLASLPPGMRLKKGLRGTTDFIHYFARWQPQLNDKFPTLKKALATNGTLWISWPKRSASLATDLNENIIRSIGLAQGLVDVKVCAIDDTWSGLKFVYRLRDRA